MRFLLLAFIGLIPACQQDETLRAYGAADQVWTLLEIDGQTFDASATLTFPDRNQVTGQAPCNSYSATMSVPYPWFETGPIVSTKKACPDLTAETAFFKALDTMSLSEVVGEVLILSTPEGRQMVFKAGA